MHKININLHNLKTALIFSMEISRLDMVYVRAKLHNFFVPPPAVRWGQETRLF